MPPSWPGRRNWSSRVFQCDGAAVDVECEAGESLSTCRASSSYRVGEGRLRRRPVRVLHCAGRRRAAARHPGRTGGGSIGDDARRARRRAPGSARRRVRRDRRIAVRLLHAGDPRARRRARRTGQGPPHRRRPRARGAPLPLHRLADHLRGDRPCDQPHGAVQPIPPIRRRRASRRARGRRCAARRPRGAVRERGLRRRHRAA